MKRWCLLPSLLACTILGTASLAESRTWYVKVDGTGDAPTIQAAIDSVAEDDVVLVAPGTYTWANQGTGTPSGMIFIPSSVPRFTLRGEGGSSGTILDAQFQGRVMTHLEMDLTIEGFTFTRGLAPAVETNFGGAILTHGGVVPRPFIRDCIFRFNQASRGGAIFYGGVGAITIEDCLFERNTATASGGAVYLINSPVEGLVSVIRRCTFRDNAVTTGMITGGGAVGAYNMVFRIEECTFERNEALGNGGAIESSITGPNLVRSCTILQNTGANGSAIAATAGGTLTIENCIIVENVGNDAVYAGASGAAATLACSDLFGNIPGDWTGSIAPQQGVNGNFSEDPQFCSDNLGLHRNSPCASGKHPNGVACGLIGAHRVRCGATPIQVREETWGGIKTLYRE